MKLCSECGFPIQTSQKTIDLAWKYLTTQSFEDAQISTKNKQKVIEYKQRDTTFRLFTSKKPMKAIEEWDTPFGIHNKTERGNRGVLARINKWYMVLARDPGARVLQSLANKGLLNLELENDRQCSVCSKTTSISKIKSQAKKTKRKAKKKGPTEPSIKIEERKFDAIRELSTVPLRAEIDLSNDALSTSADLKMVTLKELKAVSIKERIEAAKKQKIEWKELVVMYLEENVTNTKARHLDNIAESLDLKKTQALELIDQLIDEGTVQKEFEFSEFFILSQNYQGEITRKYLEIQDYLKNHYCEDPNSKCTQVSVSLFFDLPFAIVGVLLNGMLRNRLIEKETAEILEGGISRKIRYFVPATY